MKRYHAYIIPVKTLLMSVSSNKALNEIASRSNKSNSFVDSAHKESNSILQLTIKIFNTDGLKVSLIRYPLTDAQ